jgi:hypothetical protein
MSKLDKLKPIAESLYFALEPKTLKPLFNKVGIIKAIKKKTGVTITRQTLFNWEKQNNWKIQLENYKLCHTIGDYTNEPGKINEFGKNGEIKIKDLLQTEKLGYDKDQDLNEVLRKLITDRRNYIVTASEVASEMGMIGRVIARVKFHKFMKALTEQGVDEIKIEDFYNSQEITNLITIQNQFIKQMVSINAKDTEMVKLNMDQRKAIEDAIHEAVTDEIFEKNMRDSIPEAKIVE